MRAMYEDDSVAVSGYTESDMHLSMGAHLCLYFLGVVMLWS